MNRNLSSSRIRWRKTNPMVAVDRLPPDLRAWAASAALPWSATSLLGIWQRALRDTGCPKVALERLCRAEAMTLARDAAVVWGPDYPTGTADPAA
jgi:hypothetical protein